MTMMGVLGGAVIVPNSAIVRGGRARGHLQDIALGPRRHLQSGPGPSLTPASWSNFVDWGRQLRALQWPGSMRSGSCPAMAA